MFTWLVKSGIKAAEVANTVGKVATVASGLIKEAGILDTDASKEKKLDGSSESGVSASIEAAPSEVDPNANVNSGDRAVESGTKKKGSGRSETWEDASWNWTPEENKSKSYLLLILIFALIALAIIWVSSSGDPRSPDITGWRFEETKGSVEGEDEDLTIYSRLGNNSDGPLPYPLIAISLTDRFAETIGSRVLDPAEYLSSDLDPRKLVEPGNTFNAVITIKSLAEDATGFKLKVCYRLSDGQLHCAIDDFN